MIRKEDKDPVFYCRRCLSLGIEVESGQDFCNECGSTDIGELPDIYVWEEMFLKKYGYPYIDRNPEKSIFD